jgi:endonuclease/exonuclease/phosphatase family metal-dependent hydrolase
MAVVRVATYNIRSLRDDKAAVVRVISALRADVVCIQEAPRFLFWRRKCRWLAQASGMKIVGGGRSAGANLLLAAPDVHVDQSRDVLFTKDFRLHQRGVAMADVTAQSARFVVAGTHLDGVEEPRLRHIDELHRALDEFTRSGVPSVVAGDINDEPGSAAWAKLTKRHVDAAAVQSIGDPRTSQPRTPTRRIDAIFAGPGFIVRTTEAVDSPGVNAASDHRPVVAELELPDL